MAQDADTMRTAAIRSHIERTRVELGHTIDAIQHRLSPQRALHEARQTISDATLGRARRLAHRMNDAMHSAQASPEVAAVIDKARRNPAATAFIGSALGALLVMAIARSRRTESDLS
jgi:hypothetical protein